MKILKLVQGSPEWEAARFNYRCASEAPMMMGCRNKPSRSDLVRMKATGAQQEFSSYVRENVLEEGHAVEAAARPIAEEIIGETLYPITGTDDAGTLLASFDGLTIVGDKGWECKQWNEGKAADVLAGKVPDVDYWQVVQQLVVSEADEILYMVTDGTREKCVYVWVSLAEGVERELLASWAQFDQDVANYQHVETPAAAVAAPIADLPALSVSLVGSVQATNLPEWRDVVVSRIQAINTNLQTDQDFADAGNMVKFLGDAEKSIELVKKQALSQTASIADLFSTLDALSGEMKQKRLTLDKLVEKRKNDIRGEIQNKAQTELSAFIAETCERLGLQIQPKHTADFAAVMRQRKTVATLRDAVSTELARAKVEISTHANEIDHNQRIYATLAAGHEFLFADLKQLLAQSPDAFSAMVENRITKHKLEEQERKAKAEEAAAPAVTIPLGTIPAGTVVTQEVIDKAAAAAVAIAISPASNVKPLVSSELPTDDGKKLKLGEICQALGVTVTTEFLERLGFVAQMEKNARLYRQCDFPAICRAIAGHVLSKENLFQKAA